MLLRDVAPVTTLLFYGRCPTAWRAGAGGSGRGRGSERGAPRLSSEAAIPGLDINPPDLENGRSSPKSENGDGVGGWISNMVNKSKGDGDSAGGKYKRVGQDED